MALKCKNCGVEFEPQTIAQKYCCVACRKQYYIKSRSPVKCKHCGKEFIPNSNRQYYCSRECVRASYADIRKEKQTIFKKKCDCCGKEFETTNNHQHFCSKECSIIDYRRRPKRFSCKHCGKIFEKTTYAQYCSIECRREAERVKHFCVFCSEEFYPKGEQLACDACRVARAKLDRKPGKSRLNEMSGDDLLHYGRISAAKQIERMRGGDKG